MFKYLKLYGVKLSALVLLLSVHSPLFAQFYTGVALDGSGLPAADLLYQGQVLNSERAWQIRHKVDLASLNPQENEIWSSSGHLQLTDYSISSPGDDDLFYGQSGPGSYASIDQTLRTLQENSVLEIPHLNYQGTIQSHSGLLRFNAYHTDSELSFDRVMTVYMDKTLHTLLLRKHFLDLLGYKLPPIHYFERIWVEFDTGEEMDDFLSRVVPRETLGSSQRWVVERRENKVLLQDVALSIPSEFDHYNVALGVPPGYLSSRTLRALLLVYAVLDLDESVNKFNWFVGQEKNGEVVLPHFVNADFSTTLDDAMWMLSKLSQMSRGDIEKAVKLSAFPKEVEKVVIEKVLARLRSLFKQFDNELYVQVAERFSFDSSISYGENLIDGVLQKEEWEGHASRYAHGIPDSPFDGVVYNVLAAVQSATIDELIFRVNRELSLFDVSSARGDFLFSQFQDGLENFVETGEFSKQPIGLWVSPLLSGQLIVSRDIVVGPYLGTDNLVQMADTFGYGAQLGAHIGFDSIDSVFSGALRANMQFIRTFTHLTPVKTLKESLKTPYTNIYVPYLKRQLEQVMSDISDTSSLSSDEVENRLLTFAKDLDDKLGVGESLIITERLGPEVRGTGILSYSVLSRMSVSTGLGGAMVKRTHLYRKDANTLQIYVDNGLAKNLDVSFRLDHYIPVLELRYRRSRGNYQVESYQLNLTADLEENPDLPKKAVAVYQILNSGSSELLADKQSPFRVSNRFNDASTQLRIFHWRKRGLTKSGLYEIETPENYRNYFMRLTEARQSGVNYRDFGIDIVNYFLGEYMAGIQLDTNRWQNPGQTFYGFSQTRRGRFDAVLEVPASFESGERELSRSELDSFDLNTPFMAITYDLEGWRASRDKIIKFMLELNERVGREIFDPDFIRDVASMRLYNLELNINLYEGGIERLSRLDNSVLQNFERKYSRRNAFDIRCRNIRFRNSIECGNLRLLREQNSRCQGYLRNSKNRDYGRCLLNLAMKLEKALDFDDFLEVVGADNIYVYGRLNGLRENNEVLLSPIESNTIGRISSRFWNGPLEYIRSLSGITPGEFEGSWLREDF